MKKNINLKTKILKPMRPLTLRDLPKEERPRERLKKVGAE